MLECPRGYRTSVSLLQSGWLVEMDSIQTPKSTILTCIFFIKVIKGVGIISRSGIAETSDGTTWELSCSLPDPFSKRGDVVDRYSVTASSGLSSSSKILVGFKSMVRVRRS